MKKLLSLALILAMVLTMSVTAFAQEITGESGSTDITYTANESYVVTIPDSMKVGEDANVSVKDVVLAANKQLTVSVSSEQYNNGWKLKNGDETIGYTLKIDNTDVANNGTVLTVKSGDEVTKTLKTTLTGTAKYSGTYTDTLTFNIELADTPKIVTKLEADEDIFEQLEDVTFTVTYADGQTTTINHGTEGLTYSLDLYKQDPMEGPIFLYTASYGGATCMFRVRGQD